jgi:hypothetical protein
MSELPKRRIFSEGYEGYIDELAPNEEPSLNDGECVVPMREIFREFVGKRVRIIIMELPE